MTVAVADLPDCALCRLNAQVCAYHRAQDAAALARALLDDIQKRGALGLVRFYNAALSRLVPPAALAGSLSELDDKPVVARMQRLLASDELGADEFYEIAACALALATLYDGDDDDDDDARD